MDLRDRILCSTLRSEAIAAWLEVRFEDRLEHQLQRGLHDPVCRRRDPQASDLARRFRDRLLPHPLRNEPAGLQVVPDIRQHHPDAKDDRSRCDPIDPGGSCALVAPHPIPRHDEERRVIYEVEQVIEATVMIVRCPLVQLCLHRVYPQFGLNEARPRCAGIHRRPPRSSVAAANTLDPFAMCPALSGSPDALLRRGPLRTERAVFTALGSGKLRGRPRPEAAGLVVTVG